MVCLVGLACGMEGSAQVAGWAHGDHTWGRHARCMCWASVGAANAAQAVDHCRQRSSISTSKLMPSRRCSHCRVDNASRVTLRRLVEAIDSSRHMRDAYTC